MAETLGPRLPIAPTRVGGIIGADRRSTTVRKGTRMKPWFATFLLSVCCIAGAGEAPVSRATFDGPEALAAWQGDAGRLVDSARGTSCLMIESAKAGGRATRTLSLPADKLAGSLVTVRADVKAEKVSVPPKSWNGIKVMLVLETEHGRQYPQLPLGTGTFDWMTVTRVMRIPRAVRKATLVVGLELVSGSAWFDNIEIQTGRPTRGGRRSKTMFKGHDLPRLRGVMHGPQLDEKNIRDLAAWGANQVRWQLNWVPMKQAEEWARDLDRYDKWLDGALEQADKALDACEKHGILVLLDLHCPPGGRAQGGVCRMLSEARYRDKFLEVWDRIARRYKGRRIIYAYDLVNEAVEPARGAIVTWRDLATQATRRIRAIDPDKPVVFEPGPWGGPDGFDQLVPLDIDRVIYSFHMYKPHQFTHQGVHGSKVGLRYPGTIAGEQWDKERLREAMQPAIDFQRAFNVHMYVGEFSAIRWAPDGSAHRYLRDCIDLFEELGWDWSYHAFREWSGWSVEHTTDPKDSKPSPTPTAREQLLRRWFARNVRPKPLRQTPSPR